MRKQIMKISVLEASERIGVSRTTVRTLIERAEIEKVQEHPVLVSVPSVIRYIQEQLHMMKYQEKQRLYTPI